MKSIPRPLCAPALLFALLISICGSPVNAETYGYGPSQKFYQKGYGAKQKGGYPPLPRHHICLPAPDAPLLQSAGILRVAGPRRDIRFSVRQESGDEESADEEAMSEIEELKQRMTDLEKRFDMLFRSVDKLVEKLQPAP